MNAVIDISGIILKTPRLRLRQWKSSDLYDMFSYASSPGLGEMAGWRHHNSIDDSRQVLNYFIKTRKTFALEFEGRVIGSLGVDNYDEKLFPQLQELSGRELGYALSRDFWGRGLMPEAVNAAADWLFKEKMLDFLLCSHYMDNNQSARVIEKCGFTFLRPQSVINQMAQNKTALFYIKFNSAVKK